MKRTWMRWQAWKLWLPGRWSLAFLGCLLGSGCLSQRGTATEGDGPVQRAQKPEPNSSIKRTMFETIKNPLHMPPDAEIICKVRAHVNGEPILDEEVREACYIPLMQTLQLPESQRADVQADILANTLQNIIDREVMIADMMIRVGKAKPQYLEKIQEAATKEFDKKMKRWREDMEKKNGKKFDNDDEFKKLLKSSGINVELMKRREERQFISMEYARSLIHTHIERIGHQHLKDYYEAHANEFSTVDAVDWHHIFIAYAEFPSREQARSRAPAVLSHFQKGEDIANLLKYDNGDSVFRKGAGMGRLRGEIKPPELEEVLFSMKEGEVGPMMETPVGIHVYRLVKREHAGQKPLDAKVQAEIRKKIQTEIAEREFRRLIAELRKRATIEISKN